MIESLSLAIVKITLSVIAGFLGFLWAYQKGKKKVKEEQDDHIIDDIYTARQVRDRLQYDDHYADSVRRRFKR